MGNQQDRVMLMERRDLRGALVVITGFLALLCWWIGLSGYLNVGGFISGGGGFLTFLLVPVLATAATCLAARSGTRSLRGAGAGRHRA
ncbi:hypothetical protein [Pseudarthrobacter sp. H2]|uniref:hypothetical protein n=1 Tax=Pseudarthrobacter sp. H2 TaxID=3418415 RepID=UPI003CF2C4E6